MPARFISNYIVSDEICRQGKKLTERWGFLLLPPVFLGGEGRDEGGSGRLKSNHFVSIWKVPATLAVRVMRSDISVLT